MESFLKRGKISASTPSGINNVQSEEVTKSKGLRNIKETLQPWVEKYRPRSITDIAYQDEVVNVLKNALETNDLPNLLFHGPPGTGKTSTILAVARDIFGPSYFRQRVLELNASDERGIAVVRDKVKRFSQTTVVDKRPDGSRVAAFKIVILDEADSMTRDAQSALRRIMEKEGNSTRFCLICNYVSRIIEPLTSRCAKFRFKPLIRDVILQRLNMISAEENLQISEKAMDCVITNSEGDMRKAITTLQSLTRLRGGSTNMIESNDVSEITGVIPMTWITQLMEVCGKNSYDGLQAFVEDLLCEGFSAYQLILQIQDYIVSQDGEMSEIFCDSQRAAISHALALNEYRLLDGSNEYLQIMDLCSLIMKEINK